MDSRVPYPERPAVWSRLREMAHHIRVDSVKIGPATIKLQSRTTNSDAFSTIAAKLQATVARANDVFVISAHNLDEVTMVDRITADHECEALGPAQRHPGGSGANTAYALSVLGATVEVVGSVGADEDGRLLMASLESVGVGIALLQCIAGEISGWTQNIVDRHGRRLLVVHPNANDFFAEAISLQTLLHASSTARILHLSSFVDERSLALQTSLLAQLDDDVIVSLAPGALYARRGLDRLEGLIKNIDIMFLYREQLTTLIYESSALSFSHGDSLQSLLNAYFAWKERRAVVRPQVIVVKDSVRSESGHVAERFLAVASGTTTLERFFYPRELPAGTHIPAIDTTGMGDAAAAGFLIGILNGGSMEACLDAAFLLSCFVSTSIGARSAFTQGHGPPF